jgi:hypothetical protein
MKENGISREKKERVSFGLKLVSHRGIASLAQIKEAQGKDRR